MKVKENHCVDCDLPCLGKNCPLLEVTVFYCENHSGRNAEYRIEDEDLCEECVKKYIDEVYEQLSLLEKAKLLDINLKKCWDL